MKIPIVMFFIVSFSVNASSQLWKQYMDSAKNYKNSGKTDKALNLYIKAKEELQRDSAETTSHARVCSEIAILYLDKGQYNLAEPLFSDAKNIREKVLGKDDPDYASSCNNLAAVYTQMGIYEKAKNLYIEAKDIRQNKLGKEHRDYASSCNNLGELYRRMGQFGLAEPLFIEAKNIREKIFGKESAEYASSCSNLAGLYSGIGQSKKAEPLFIEALHTREKVLGKTHPDYARTCNNLALLYYELGKYEKSEILYLEAKNIREKVLGKTHPDYASSCSNLGSVYMDMGLYEKSIQLYTEAKVIRENSFGKEHPDYAASCGNLANLFYKTQQYEKAETLYIEAKEIIEKVFSKEHPDYAKTCDNLAAVYKMINQNEKAESLRLTAKSIREKTLGKDNLDYALSCSNLAVIYANTGRYEMAESLFLEAMKIREEKLGMRYSKYAENCINLVCLYWNTGQYEKAKTYQAEAFQSQREQIRKIFQFTSEAEKQYYLRSNKKEFDVFFSFNYFGYSSNRQGFIYDVSLANRHLILSSSQQLRSVINASNDTIIKNKYSRWMSAREQISSWIAKPIVQRPVYLKDLEEQSNTLEKELTRLSFAFRNQNEKAGIIWQSIRQNLQSDEAAIEFVEFQFHTGKSWTDSIYYIALLLRKDMQEPKLIFLFEKNRLDALLKTARKTVQNDKDASLYTNSADEVENKSSSVSFYELAWQPLEKNLNGITKVYFAPAGLLHRVSFAAIPVNNKEVLSDKYQLIQLNTTASVVKLPVNFLSASDKIILYGGVSYDADSSSITQASLPYATNISISASLPRDLDRSDRGNGWEYLPASQEEVNEIERLGKQKKMSLTLLDSINATEESIKSLNAKNSPAVIHVATHGFFFPDPKENKKDDQLTRFETSGKAFRQSENPLFRSGLLFAGANNAWKGKPIEGVEDGILTAYEVSNLYLPNTKLVVLSACETGLGDIQGSEGVYGLQRSFKMAGVQNLVMSLWKVPDDATSEFMQLFYQNMFNKQSISDAFYHAQAAMKNKYRDNPYNWAAWVLVR